MVEVFCLSRYGDGTIGGSFIWLLRLAEVNSSLYILFTPLINYPSSKKKKEMQNLNFGTFM